MFLIGKHRANLLDRRFHAGSCKQTVSSAVLHKDRAVGSCERRDVRMIQIGVHAESVEESRMHGVGISRVVGREVIQPTITDARIRESRPVR